MSASGWRTSPLPAGWPALREQVLARDPVCRWPGGCTLPSREVDHVGVAGDHRPEMLRGLCTGHHRIRTAAQGGAAAGALRSAMAAAKKRPAEKHPGLKENA